MQQPDEVRQDRAEPDAAAPGSRAGEHDGGIFARRYLAVTIGTCALILLTAFEALAVTTVMPTISRELHGSGLYALAFAGPLASGVVGMVVAGNWSDRRGPRGALYASVALFLVGLAVVGLAGSMGMFVAGRLVQGLGSGGLTVVLYVIVARVYPSSLHPRIFAAFAAAWVVPSLIGPFFAGLVTQTVGWRWVFLGVIALVIIAMAMIIPATRSVILHTDAAQLAPWNLRRIGWSLLAAVAVLAVNLTAEASFWLFRLAAILAVAVAIGALRPLLPSGTLSAARGLPSVILIRGLMAGAFFGAELYIPYLLTANYDFQPAAAGLALTFAGLTWSFGSWLQSRFAEHLSHARSIAIGGCALTLAVAAACATAVFALSPVVIVVGWAFGGLGMGLMYPRTSVATLDYSTTRNQGFNSSGLSIADSIGASISVAAGGIVFALLGPLGGGWPFAGAFGLTVLLALGVLALGPRVTRPPS